ncbi:MAG: hypothetical protein R3E12_12235 [Candidatus Eisenbacteria bacterium]
MRIDRQGLSARVPAALGTAALLCLSFASIASSYVLIDAGGGRGTAWIKPEHPVVWHLNTTKDDPTISNEFDILRQCWRAWDQRVPNIDLEFVEGTPTSGATCGLQVDGINNLSMLDCLTQCTGGCLGGHEHLHLLRRLLESEHGF